MIDHDFKIQDRQKSDLPDFLKKGQTGEGQEDPEQNRAFNKAIHVDLINADLHLNEASGQTILSITDDTRTFNQVAILANDKIDSTAAAISHHWCQPMVPTLRTSRNNPIQPRQGVDQQIRKPDQ